MNKKITIVKQNAAGTEVFRYGGELVRQTSSGLMVSAIFEIPYIQVDEVAFKAGDRSFEYYLYDKWFNIYQVHEGMSAEVKAWYCNICRPMVFTNGQVEYEDMELDLLVYPDGRQVILDRDEFRALRINGHERRLALEGMQELHDIFKDIRALDLASLLA